MEKRLLTMMLVSLSVSLARAEAISRLEIGDIAYNLVTDTKEASVTEKVWGYSGSVVIPSEVTYEGVRYRVTSIGTDAFSNDAVTSVEIPNSVTTIGFGAFKFTRLSTVTIPNSVTSIENSAFYGCSSLNSVTIGDGVVSIGESAFSGCYELTSISIPNSVTSLGSGAFSSCTSLASVTIGDKITSLDGTFLGCSSLASITIPSNVTCIGNSVFSGCSKLTSIDIPSSVKSIGNYAFERCSGLKTVSIRGGVASIGDYAFSDCYNLRFLAIPNSLSIIGVDAFRYCYELKYVFVDNPNPISITDETFFVRDFYLYVPKGSKAAYEAAENWKDLKLILEKGFPESSPFIEFADDKVKSLCIANWDINLDGELSESEAAIVPVLGNVFYSNTEIKSFNELGYFNSLSSINEDAFRDCSSLTTVKIPHTVISIGESAFSGTGLESVVLPNSITSIDDYAFSGTGLESVILPSGIASIGWNAFESQNLKKVTSYITDPSAISNPFSSTITQTALLIIPEGTRTAYYKAGWRFDSMFEEGETIAEKEYTDEQGVKYERKQATDTGAYEYYVVGSTDALSSEIVIPASIFNVPVTRISNQSFKDCTNLTKITLPKSLTDVSYSAFEGCTGITEVVSFVEDPSALSVSFPDIVYQNAVLQVPSGTKSAYIDKSPWYKFFIYEEGSTPIQLNYTDGQGVVYSMKKAETDYSYEVTGYTESIAERVSILTEVNGIPVTSIATQAFKDCKSLKWIFIPSQITSISTDAFEGCSITLSVNQTNVGGWGNSLSVTAVELGDEVQNIDDEAFYNWKNLKTITLPEGLKSIGSSAFYGCMALESVTLPEGLTTLGSYAFYGCSNLKSVTLPESLTTLGSDAFYGCNSIETVRVECSNFGHWFENMPNIKSVYVGAGVSSGFYANSSFDANPLSGCTGIETIIVDERNPVYDSRDNCNAIIETSTNELLLGCNSTTIPATVSIINVKAFSGMALLREITIPLSVWSIGYDAFAGCTGLQDVTAYYLSPLTQNIFDDDVMKSATLHVPYKTSDKYRSSSYWNFTNIVEMVPSTDVSTAFTIPKDWTQDVDEIRDYLGNFPDLETVLVETGNPKYSSNSGLLCNAAGDSLLYVPYNYIKDGVFTVPKGIRVIPSSTVFAKEGGIDRVILTEDISYVYFPSCRVAELKTMTSPEMPYVPSILIVPNGAGKAYYDQYRSKVILEAGSGIDDVPNLDFNKSYYYGVYDKDGDGLMEPQWYANMWREPNGGLMYLDRNRHGDSNLSLCQLTDDGESKVVASGTNYSYYNRSAFADDFDNDGRMDFGTANAYNDDGITLYMQQPDGTFVETKQKVTEEEKDLEKGISGNFASAFLSIRNGMFLESRRRTRAVWSGSSSSSGATTMQTVDLNGDGVVDFANNKGIYYSLNEGDSYFYLPTGNTVYPYDVDGDGEIDYVCYDGSTLYIISDLTSSEANRQELYKNSSIDQVLFRDFDHDGDIDILAFLCAGKTSYFVFLRNNGDGTFRRKEVNFAETEYSINGCGDYDGDGCYELLVTKKGQYYYNDEEMLLKVNNDYTMTTMSDRFYADYGEDQYTRKNSMTDNTIVGDFNNDGMTEFYSLSGRLYGHLASQTIANTAPKKMSMPSAILQPENSRLKIMWQRGEDAETTACDLTYELRIGTAPGLGDVLRAESLADGRRLTTREGKQGTRLNYLFNAASLRPGKYYISVQAIDAGGLGGAFSDELVYEYEMQTPVFSVSNSSITTADTLVVYAKSLVPDATYQWMLSEGEVVEQKGNTARIVFHQQGQHEVGLSMVIDGVAYKADPQTVSVGAMTVQQYNYDLSRPILDFDQDGNIDAIGYRNTGDGKMEKILASVFADLSDSNFRFATDFDHDGYPDFVASSSKGDVFLNYGEQDFDFDYQTVGMKLGSGDMMTDLNNDGLIDYKYLDYWKMYETEDGITYEEKDPHEDVLPNHLSAVCFYDVNRDGFLDIVSYDYPNGENSLLNVYVSLKDSTTAYNYGSPQKIFSVPVEYPHSSLIVADYDNDGCVDLAFNWNKNSSARRLVVVRGKPNACSSDVVLTLDGVGGTLYDIGDVDNDGFIDIGLNNEKTLLMKADFDYELLDEKYYGSEIIPMNSQGDIYSGSSFFKSHISNEAPQAPATVAAKQTEDGLLISWSDAVDKETPAMQMRYNVSVKRKGRKGKGAFVISPMNGLMDAAAIVPGYDYKKSTQMLVPSSVLTVGETYEIQVQAIDLWSGHSPMTKPVEFTMTADGYIKVAERVRTGRETTVKFMGAKASSYSISAGEGGKVVKDLGDGEYVLSWSTPGVKELSITAGKLTVKSSVTVVDPFDLTFDLPNKIYAGAPLTIRLSDDVIRSAAPVSFGCSYEMKKYGQYFRVYLDVELKDNAAMVTFPKAGEYTIEMHCDDEVQGGENVVNVYVDEVMSAKISRVDVDQLTGRYAVGWDASALPSDIAKVIVLKEGSSLGKFNVLDTVSVSLGRYVDATSTPAVMSARYQIQLLTKGGQTSQASEAHRPLHVMLTSAPGGFNLIWDSYEGLDVDNYQIWRGSSPDNLTLLQQVAGSQRSYTDLSPLSGTAYYAVVFNPVTASQSSARTRREDTGNAVWSNVASTANAIEVIPAESIEIVRISDTPLSDEQPEIQLYAVLRPAYCTLDKVAWSIVEGEALASVDNNGKLRTKGNGSGVVKVRAKTLDGSNLSAEITVESVMSFIADDVNGDGEVDEADVREVADYIMGSPSDEFNFNAADMNGDGAVNAADIVNIVNAIGEGR